MKAHGLTREVALEPVPDTLSAAAASPLPDCAPTSHGAVQNETVAEDPSTRRGTSAPRSPGRFPRFLGEYKLLEEIARGAMGVVYRAYEEKLGRFVAIKVIICGSLASDDLLERFHREAEAIAGLDHPNIVPIYEIKREDDQPYFSMKLIEGGNLTRHIPRLTDFPEAAAELMSKVARAVDHAHQRMILHRDIKPSNILVAEHDEPYVTDFGLAKRIGLDHGNTATRTNAVMGTPAYMPPEQAMAAKSVTTAADIYSLGATLYEKLTGEPPFVGDSPAEILRLVLEKEPARPRSINPKLDRDLETICLKCLQKEPDRRYRTAAALADDLDNWQAGRPITARPVPFWERAIKWVKRKPAIAALVLTIPLGLLALSGGGIWFTFELLRERDLANRGRYAADMGLARRALADGMFHQVREQLKVYQAGNTSLGDLRSFEWYYLAKLADSALVRLRGHEKAVICVAFHPDGHRVVSGGEDGTVRIWDPGGRQAHQVFPGSGRVVHCVAASPDGCWLAAGDEDGGLRLWELESGRERVLVAHDRRLDSVAFSPDSLHLLSADLVGRIVQWNVRTGEREFPLRHSDPDEELAPVNDQTNSSGLIRGTVAAYAPDGKTIVSTGRDQWVIIWDVATRRRRDYVQAAGNIYGFSISPDGRELALANHVTGIEILNLQKLHDRSRSMRTLTSNRVGGVAFSPDGRTLAMAGYGVSGLLDGETGRIVDLFDDKVNMSPFTLAFGTSGQTLAMAVADEIHVTRLARDVNGVPVTASLGPIRRLAISPDEQLLATGREDGTIVVWDLLAGRVLQTLNGHDLGVFGVAFVPGPGGARLASAGGDGLIKIWDAEAGGKPLFALAGGPGAAYAVAGRPDGRQIAAGGGDGLVRTWDPTTGQADLPPLQHGASISALTYDPTGTTLASGGLDRTVRVWSATSGRRRLGPLMHTHQVASLAFSPNGRLLAGGGGATDLGGRILIWDASSGAIAATVECPRGVDCLSFSRDSQRIATCGSDAVVQVWDATGGHETLSLDGRGGRVSAVLFAPRDLRLYSAGRDGVVKRWDGGTIRRPSGLGERATQ
jgi:WD40 repeat protein